MPDDVAFISAILANPSENGPRLVYADWLDERGDPRGTFLRWQCELFTIPPDDEYRRILQDRIRAYCATIDPAWLAKVIRAAIELCHFEERLTSQQRMRLRLRRLLQPDRPVQFEFACPKKWEYLELTKDASIRHCDTCQRDVYLSANIEDARNNARIGRCIALDCRVVRREGDLFPGEELVVGRPALPIHQDAPVPQATPNPVDLPDDDPRPLHPRRGRRR
jgi:uncharacterized protein (TIGR02996 family)